MNIKEIFDNMNSMEKAEMLKLFEEEKKNGQIKKDLRIILHRIEHLDPDNPEVIRRLAIKFKKWCEWNKYFDFSYNIIAPQKYSVYILFKMDYGEFMMKANEFYKFIAEQLRNYADVNETAQDVIREWKSECNDLIKIGEL